MDELKDLLDLYKQSENDIHKLFLCIAKKLMCDYIIEKRGKRYAIVEIEFYLYTNNHKDYITYPREVKAGRWFFHQSGVDLSFGSEDIVCTIETYSSKRFELKRNPIFGGILIRGIYDQKRNEYIFGPQKCVDILWNDLDAFDCKNQDYPVLKKAEKTYLNNIFQCKRHINIKGKDNQERKIKDWVKRLGITISNEDVKQYREALFDFPGKFRYRFFNMQNGEEPWSFIKIPSGARPTKEETEKIE